MEAVQDGGYEIKRTKQEKKRERFAVVSEVEVNKGSVRQAGLIKYLLKDKHQSGAWLNCPNPCREKKSITQANKGMDDQTALPSHSSLFVSVLIFLSFFFPELSLFFPGVLARYCGLSFVLSLLNFVCIF